MFAYRQLQTNPTGNGAHPEDLPVSAETSAWEFVEGDYNNLISDESAEATASTPLLVLRNTKVRKTLIVMGCIKNAMFYTKPMEISLVYVVSPTCSQEDKCVQPRHNMPIPAVCVAKVGEPLQPHHFFVLDPAGMRSVKSWTTKIKGEELFLPENTICCIRQGIKN